jgi:DNA-binding TFAR19-related protein (PDSD5 family)
MSDPDSTVVRILAAMNRLTAILTLRRPEQLDPEAVAAIDRLTFVLAQLGRTVDALTEAQFRDLLSRPSPAVDQRNTSLWGSSQGTDVDE